MYSMVSDRNWFRFAGRAGRTVALLPLIFFAVALGSVAPSAAAVGTATAMTASELLYTQASSASATEPGSSSPIADQITATVDGQGLRDSYGGASVNPDGTLTVYATAAGQSAVAGALATGFGSAGAGQYQIQVVPRSLYELESDTLAVANSGAVTHFQSTSTSPFVIVSWYPEPVSGTVQFAIVGDTNTAKSTLEQLLPNIPISTVASDALTLPVRISSTQTNRFYDAPAYSSGDRLEMDGVTANKCTQNFAYTGDRSGNTYSYTAAHCGGSSVYQDHVFVANIATVYHNGDDFESYPCNCQGRVWYESSSIGTSHGYLHSVTGACNCYKGQLVAMDGSANGQQPDFAVQWAGPGCIPGGTTCGAEYATNSSESGCVAGDSGSPVYQRESNGVDVLAVGLALAQGSNAGECYYQTVGTIAGDASVEIKTGGA